MTNEIIEPDEERFELNKEKIYNSYQSQLKIHLALKNKTWRNGFVKEIRAEFFMFEDRENGVEPIFFMEVRDVKPYVTREEVG